MYVYLLFKQIHTNLVYNMVIFIKKSMANAMQVFYAN